jgi:hypothetical protein
LEPQIAIKKLTAPDSQKLSQTMKLMDPKLQAAFSKESLLKAAFNPGIKGVTQGF